MTRRARRDPLPYLIAVAVSANVGSEATIIGNPQNMLIGASSGIPFAEFTARLGPPALVGLVVALLSNLVSNVPAVMLFRPLVPHFGDPQAVWLTFAMASTFAGNLTLLGSVANLIVAEGAKRAGVDLTFGTYLRVGPPITIITIVIGGLWLAIR